jgi:hypothetical protein
VGQVRIAIIGSRGWPFPETVRAVVRRLAEKDSSIVIVSGGARGVDSVAERAAKAAGLEVVVYEADWDRHGRAAGMLRNTTIVEDADKVLVFWDGSSRGTADTVRKARVAGKPVTVFNLRGRMSDEEVTDRVR